MLMAAAVWLTTTAAVLAANPHLGTWKLNESKSKLSGGTKNNTVTYSEARDGMIKLSVEGVDKDGKATHWTWEGKFDGKQYKVKGNNAMDTIAYQMVNDRTNKFTAMKDGKVSATGTIEVAKGDLNGGQEQGAEPRQQDYTTTRPRDNAES